MERHTDIDINGITYAHTHIFASYVPFRTFDVVAVVGRRLGAMLALVK